MPDIIFRVVLPVYGALALAGLLYRRVRVHRQIGHDPVVMRPLRRTGSLAGWLELAFVVCALVSAADIILNAVAPDVVSRRLAVPLLRESGPAGWLGLTLVTAGLVVCGVAIGQMGTSWRMGVDREHPGALVTAGIYARVRHPIYTGVLLIVGGMAAATADLLSIAVAAAAAVGLPAQARLEEEFLAARHGDAYVEYLRRTRRF
jgi:protein-S-isoprenylcysteine O-methyltransferase Ste14